MACAHRPDLIVLRVDADGIDGVRLAQQLKRGDETARIPVLAIIGQFRPDLHYGGQSVGFDTVLLNRSPPPRWRTSEACSSSGRPF